MTETLIQAVDRAAIYNRISHDAAGDEHGVTNQDNGAEQLCGSRGLSVVARFSDNDISASNGDYRPDYHAMMAAAARREFDAIVVFQTSRLWRSRRERADGIEILRKAEVSVIAVKGPSLDMSTAYGRGMAGLLGEFDTMETEVKSERQKFAAEAAARGGQRWTGCPRPFGYAADHVTPDPAEAEAIADAARMLLGGSTIAAVARDWSARGLRPPQAPFGPLPRAAWTRNSVTAILRNPRLAGLAAYRGELIGLADGAETAWQPVLPPETWQAVDAMLGDPSRQRVRGVKSLLGGIARCRCGNGVTASVSGAGGRIYRCVPATRNGRPGPHVARLAAPADEHAAAVAVAILSKPDAADLVAPRHRADVTALRERAAAIRATQATMAGDAAEGLITRDEMLAGSARARARLAEIDAQLIEAGRDSVLAPLIAAQSARAAWDGLDLARKRAVLRALMTIELLPPGRGAKAFDPGTVRMEPVTP
jgi:site-specific DNA recombinase